MSILTQYNHLDSENKWQQYWKQHQIYAWQINEPRSNNFVIDTPPPTVSGLLHMGHVFSYAQADFVARFQRMQGKNVFYPMGFDDNGLPTERLVEKVINKKASIYEQENGDGSFVAKCQEIVADAEEQFENLFNQIALSVDWSQKYQTISPQVQKISQASFLDLWHKGLIEKKLAPVFYDISDRTALAQADLVDKEMQGEQYNFAFSCESENIIIMTTRPELLAACVALMINPQDGRYSHLIGKTATTAIFAQQVPIIADELVQFDKGTGAVMCCTFGDETDLKWQKKHNLPNCEIIDSFGKFIAEPKHLGGNKLYQQLLANKKLKEGKEAIVNHLQQHQLLIGEPCKITRFVKCAERSGTPIEIISQEQWFIKLLDKKQQLLDKVNECNWHPTYMKVRIQQWIDGLAFDWCISRQRFFGVPFPVWKLIAINDANNTKFVVADIKQLPLDPKKSLPAGYNNIEQNIVSDSDGKKWHIIAETAVMDTWATSSLTPQLSSYAISDNFCFDADRHSKLYPADLRPQAHEIIRTWAFYTIAKSLLHQNSIPWHNLMISGWCLAADKTKMSKSKGNVVTPVDLIANKGADVVRYWASASNLGADIAYSEDVFKIGQKLITKLFNASKFVSSHFCANQQYLSSNITQTADIWIIQQLQTLINRYNHEFNRFEYAKARELVEEFFWHYFCDNYLEICKVRCYGLLAEKYQNQQLDAQQQQQIISQQLSAVSALYFVLNALLKLFAPFLPHICEELYSLLFTDEFLAKKSIHSRGNKPELSIDFANISTDDQAKDLLAIIFAVRKYKSERNLSMKTTIDTLTINSNLDASLLSDLANVCNAKLVVNGDSLLIDGEKLQ
jgi:valyl-tRNA synthetase